MKSWFNFIGSNFFLPIKAERKYVYTIVVLAAVVIVQTVVLVDFWRQYRPIMPSYTPTFSGDNQSTTSGSYDNADLSGIALDQTPEVIYPESVIKVQWEKKLQPYTCHGQACYEYGQYYIAGRILDGDYTGDQLIMSADAGMGGYSFSYYALTGDGLLNLGERNVKMAGVDNLPEEIAFLGTNYKLSKGYASSFFSELKLVKKVFTDPQLGDFYLTDNDCLVVELPNHVAMPYNLVIPFVNPENGQVSLALDGKKPSSEAYGYTQLTCGSLCQPLTIVDEKDLKPAERLVTVGRFSNGESAYGIKNSNDKVLKDLYEDKGTVAYYSESYDQQPTSKYTFQQFLAYLPYFYWQDPLGRWIEFKNQRFVFAAEMCKPVIYLYPEKTAKLSVKVNPNGGFTYTDPPYGAGWEVEATPESQITDLHTGQVYDYLFWEGIGLNYPRDNQGWVVKQSDISRFFDEKLPLLGLTAREIKDFKEYWVNRLQNKPYYHLQFLPQADFDKIAPLAIGPDKPWTVIRVMLTARGRDADQAAVPQDLPRTPARNGFTVVEWGGVVFE